MFKQALHKHVYDIYLKNYKLFLGRKERGERDQSFDLVSHFLMHSLVASYMCPEWKLNLQPWHVRTIL